MYIPGDKARDVVSMNTLAGQRPKYWSVQTRDRAVASTSLAMSSDSFDAIVQAMREKFGKESSLKRGTIKNRMGASFDQEEVRWTRGGRILALTKRSHTVDEMQIMLISEAELAAGERDAAQAAKKSDKDM